MKKIILILTLISLSLVTKAQNIEEIDSLDISAEEAINYALAPLPTYQITSGFWKEKAVTPPTFVIPTKVGIS